MYVVMREGTYFVTSHFAIVSSNVHLYTSTINSTEEWFSNVDCIAFSGQVPIELLKILIKRS